MEVSLALLADYANVSVEGKLNIMGIFSLIYAPAVPTIHPQMRLVIQFKVDPAERGTSKMIEIKLLDADGNLLAGVGQNIQIPEDAPLNAEIPQIAVLNGLTFPKYGDYAFKILVNQDTKKTVSFTVAPVPTGPMFGITPPSR